MSSKAMGRLLLIPNLLAIVACLSAARPEPAFDGERAFEHVRQLVSIGPRAAGSPGAARAREYITRQLDAIGIATLEQPFEADTPIGRVRMVNLRATLPGPSNAAGKRLLIGSHYDTKLFPDAAFVGANDAGSSTGFLIEFARTLKDLERPLPVELVFFDGEEAFVDWFKNDDNTYGSRHYVAAALKDGTAKDIGALILVDMIGDRDLRILREPQSTPWLTDIIWNAARRLGRKEFADEEFVVEDDHLPFLRAGIPAVDIIDLDYPAWHTPDDTLDKISAASLQAVGDVLLAALPDVFARLQKRE